MGSRLPPRRRHVGETIMKKLAICLTGFLLIGATIVLAQTFGVKKRMPKPHEFGNVVMNNYAEENKMAPVVFRHWFHRSKYTCRLCHVDLGFAMVVGETGVREDDVRNGIYCGACHDGTTAFAPEELNARGEVKKENCARCHSQGQEVEFEYDFYDYVKGFPKSRFGNRVDWMVAEEQGLIELSDYIEGVTIRRRALQDPKDAKLEAKVAEMPDIIFSHEKHAVWNGCELCHPDVFGVKTGGTVYEMQDIFDGKFCGACHGSVAFMNMDCQLCHTEDVY
jgi:c(7)-type cytochrome triheme protein